MTATLLSAGIAGLVALAVGWWARKGQDGASAAQLAGKVMEQLDGRVGRLEGVLDWHILVGSMKDGHILALNAHILSGHPPPPPTPPVYPPRPA